MQFSISPKKITQVFAIMGLYSALASIAGQFSKYELGNDYLLGFVPLFDISNDSSIPTWYSSATLLLASIFLALIAYAKKREGERFVPHWVILSLVFLCLSVDETARIHETVGDTLKAVLTGNTQGLLFYTWVIPGAAFVFFFGIAYLKFLANLPVKTRWLFIIAGVIYVGGAIGVEMINARHDFLYGNKNFTYHAMTTVEELCEMMGIVVFLYALTSYMLSHVREVSIRLNYEETCSEPLSSLIPVQERRA